MWRSSINLWSSAVTFVKVCNRPRLLTIFLLLSIALLSIWCCQRSDFQCYYIGLGRALSDTLLPEKLALVVFSFVDALSYRYCLALSCWYIVAAVIQCFTINTIDMSLLKEYHQCCPTLLCWLAPRLVLNFAVGKSTVVDIFLFGVSLLLSPNTLPNTLLLKERRLTLLCRLRPYIAWHIAVSKKTVAVLPPSVE